ESLHPRPRVTNCQGAGASTQVGREGFGRRRKVADATHLATARRMRDEGHTARDVAKYLGVSRATLYRYLSDETAA
ncbi:helix-turn-helix domain-containing protein, partial [Mycobacterium gordonae]|uniref:helix-turn-helix domain-containing protein n=1 Tax=Mycobacterium gordonae TaxID=1778 RepID=UPI0012E3479A